MAASDTETGSDAQTDIFAADFLHQAVPLHQTLSLRITWQACSHVDSPHACL